MKTPAAKTFARHGVGRSISALGLAFLALGCSSLRSPSLGRGPVDGDRYVALGSSFAAGPGLVQETPTTRCARSIENYAHILADSLALELADVSCSGATTNDVLSPGQDLPAQISAITPRTKLVTITIGGNDVGYIGGLVWGACASLPIRDPRCRPTIPSSEADWRALESRLDAIAEEIARLAPQARLVFVGYLTVVPANSTCPNTPLSAEALVEANRTADRLNYLTAEVARKNSALFLDAGAMSVNNHACAPEPWVSGFPNTDGVRPGAPFHPNATGMKAIAAALEHLVTS